MSYNNFHDPLGLIVRMLRSGNGAARFTVFREILSLLLKPLDHALSILEKRLVRDRVEDHHFPTILIIGNSRSGTTLLYEVLARYLSATYFDNFGSWFPKSPIIAQRLSQYFPSKNRGAFTNYYGSVSGLRGPNDGFHIWNRWFGEDRNHPEFRLDQKTADDLRIFFSNWFSFFPKPFLNKNNRNSLCIPALEAALEPVFYIHIHRDPIYVAQSLIISRKIVQGAERYGWGLGSQDSPQTENPFSYLNDVCNQVYRVERSIEDSLRDIPHERCLTISYEDFCSNPALLVRSVSEQFLRTPISSEALATLGPLNATNVQKLDDPEFGYITKRIRELSK